MTTKEAEDIFAAIRRSQVVDLRTALVKAAVRYARIRTDYCLADHAERMELEAGRTRAHNVLIDACNILARAMKQNGESIDWRVRLTDDRKVIGDFACHLHALLGIQVR